MVATKLNPRSLFDSDCVQSSFSLVTPSSAIFQANPSSAATAPKLPLPPPPLPANSNPHQQASIRPRPENFQQFSRTSSRNNDTKNCRNCRRRSGGFNQRSWNWNLMQGITSRSLADPTPGGNRRRRGMHHLPIGSTTAITNPLDPPPWKTLSVSIVVCIVNELTGLRVILADSEVDDEEETSDFDDDEDSSDFKGRRFLGLKWRLARLSPVSIRVLFWRVRILLWSSTLLP